MIIRDHQQQQRQQLRRGEGLDVYAEKKISFRKNHSRAGRVMQKH